MAECATPSGLEKAKEQLRKFTSKQALADIAELSRSTVQKFFAGKGIGLDSFKAICTALELDWEETAGLKSSEEEVNVTSGNSAEIDLLVSKARKCGCRDIEKRCGWMKVLDMTQPIGLGAIYTDVNILEKVVGKTRREIAELIQQCGSDDFERAFLGDVRERRVDAIETVAEKKQLMILGRPGAGKTTFMKRMATLCNQSVFLKDFVPIFVSLKEFAETINQPRLLNFIAHYFVGDRAPIGIEIGQVRQILKQGRGLVLLDGLDEVLEKDYDRVLREIREFARHYDRCHIVITCRIAAKEDNFEQFTEVEMANFSDEQIQSFADKWFKAKDPSQVNESGDSTVAQLFYQALEAQKPIKELAQNPLLLTLLCLEFEESSEFPQSRAELYERGLNVLLSKWDGKRRIKRGEIYKRLSTKRKEIMLGRLAMHTFERGEYFFPTRVAEKQIWEYIQNLPDASTDLEALIVDSQAVLKAIESHHGLLTERARDIYSFSHLTFHEYFTAKHILETSASDAQHNALHQLVEHLMERRWKEVFLLVAERIENADYLLTTMLIQINSILREDKGLQKFLSWSNSKTDSVNVSYKPVAVRAFYLYLTLALNDAYDSEGNNALYLTLALDSDLYIDLTRDLYIVLDLELYVILDLTHASHLTFARNLYLDLALSRNLYLDLALSCALDFAYARVLNITRARALNLAIDLALSRALCIKLPAEFKESLQSLQSTLSSMLQNQEIFEQRWKVKGQAWREQLNAVMIQHRDIGHERKFNSEQLGKLDQYYAANLLLAECLKRAYVSNEVRQRIENEMLMPSAS